MNRILLYLLLPCFLFSLSCSEDEALKTYSVEPELDSYLQRFLTAAKQHGKNFDLEKEGIIMEFADLPSPKIGLCHLTDPIKVQIDRAFWAGTKGKADQETQRENTVFHELGHGLLRRQHVNTTLPDTEWKSIMCGGEQVGDRGWFVNFTGARKQYYLDELFNPATEAPDYMKMIYQEVKKKAVVGQLDIPAASYVHNRSSSNLLNVMMSADFGTDFYLEVEASMDSSVTRRIGLFAGSADAYNYFDLLSSGRAIMMNTTCYEPFGEVFLPESVSLQGMLKLGILRQGDEISYYVNGLRFYWNDFPFGACDKLGLCLPANDRVILKSFTVYSVE